MQLSNNFTHSATPQYRRRQLLYFYYRHVAGFSRSKAKRLLAKFEPTEFFAYQEEYSMDNTYVCDGWSGYDDESWQSQYADYANDKERSANEKRELGLDPNCDIDEWEFIEAVMKDYTMLNNEDNRMTKPATRSSSRFTVLKSNKMRRYSNKIGGYKYFGNYDRYDCFKADFLATKGVKRMSKFDCAKMAESAMDEAKVLGQSPCHDDDNSCVTMHIDGIDCLYIKGRAFVML